MTPTQEAFQRYLEEQLWKVQQEYTSKAELRRIARGALIEILVTRQLLAKQQVAQ